MSLIVGSRCEWMTGDPEVMRALGVCPDRFLFADNPFKTRWSKQCTVRVGSFGIRVVRCGWSQKADETVVKSSVVLLCARRAWNGGNAPVQNCDHSYHHR